MKMKAVGVKILKAKLSEYLRMVKAGQTVLVTERDEVIAELRPSRRQPLGKPPAEQVLDELAESGVLTRSSEPGRGWSPSKSWGDPSIASSQLLDELRGDRE